MSIDFNQLKELLGAIAETDITELILKNDDFELTVRKNKTYIPPPNPAETPDPSPRVPPPPPQPPTDLQPVPPATQVSPPSPVEKKWVEISSPMVGTFYSAPGPDEPPFVKIGDRIGTGQTVCIIEAMKLMNEIEAEVCGEVMEVAVKNGESVEFGQTLMWINPAQ